MSSQYNYSIPYNISTSTSPVQGEIILPTSLTDYIMVQWDPYWQYGYKGGGGGQFNIWVVHFTQASQAQIKYSSNGVGSGYFMPRPYDIICFTATYNASTNSIVAYAVDLNTGAVASVSQPLPSFASPTPGTYVIGVAGNTGGSYADWRALYVAYK
ncbi:MAG: hypothetical protein TU35_001970 [Thermoproteus sp. AZ2]|uniref:Uncharacterized protein n=1 Tax=Thermoproteus sp. AZ2 TaxID=1609232 RepID=A0ACC6UZ82_9CREN